MPDLPPPTPEEIARWRELDLKATKGPWYSWLPRDCDTGCRTIRTEKGRTHGGYNGTELAGTHGLSDDATDKANAALIAEYRTAVPRLLDRVEELEAENKQKLGRIGELVADSLALRAKADKLRKRLGPWAGRWHD